MSDNVILTMRGISKEFPGVKALSNVDFTLCKGEIHALMGENGAGKSTLVKTIMGNQTLPIKRRKSFLNSQKLAAELK